MFSDGGMGGRLLKQKVFFSVMKGLCALFFLLYCYPFFFLINGMTRPEDGAAVSLLETAAMIPPGGIGWLLGIGLGKTKLGLVKRNMIRVAMMFPIAAVFFYCCFSLRGLWVAVPAAVFSAVFYFMGYMLAYLSYDDIVSGKRYLVLAALYGCAILAANLLGIPADVPVFILLFAAATVIYLVQANQSNIDYLMARRKHPLSQLPEKIRRYNLFLTGGMVIFLFLLFLLKDWLAAALGWLGELLRKGIVYLLSLMDNKTEYTPPSSGNQLPPELEQITQEASGSNPIAQAIFYIVVSIILVGVIIIYRKEILSAFLGIYRRMKKLLSRILHRKYEAKRVVDDSSEYYIDIEEELLPFEDQSPRRRLASPLRQWRKEVRRYEKMAGGEEKFRRGYALILKWLIIQKIPIRPADTTLEILDKAQASIPRQEFAPSTEAYNALRYGEREFPPEKLSQVDSLLGSLMKG